MSCFPSLTLCLLSADFGVGAFEVQWKLNADYSFASAGQMRVVYSSTCRPAPPRHSAATGHRATPPRAAKGSVDYRLPVPLANLAQVLVAVWLFVLCGRSLGIYVAAQRDLSQRRQEAIAHAQRPSNAAAPREHPQPPPSLACGWTLMIMTQCLVNVAASLTQTNPLTNAFFDPGGLLLGISVAVTWFNAMVSDSAQSRIARLGSGIDKQALEHSACSSTRRGTSCSSIRSPTACRASPDSRSAACPSSWCEAAFSSGFLSSGLSQSKSQRSTIVLDRPTSARRRSSSGGNRRALALSARR